MLSTSSTRSSRAFGRGCAVLAALVPLLLSCSRSGPSGPGGAPVLVKVIPAVDRVEVTTGQPVPFEVQAESQSGRPLKVEFRVDAALVSTGARFLWTPRDPGAHVVEAIVSDGLKETHHAWRVSVAPAAAPPIAALALDPTSGVAPLPVRLRLSGSDADGAVVRYRVEIVGDTDLTLVRDAPIDTTLVFAEGSFDVTATVEDDDGRSGRASGQVVVHPVPNLAPVADLTVTPSSGTAPLDVLVEGRGSDDDGRIVRYELDLDDDGVFELAAPTRLVQNLRFTAATERWIRLRVTDDREATARDSIRVTVGAPAPSPPVPSPPPSPPPSSNAAPTLTLDVSPTDGVAPLAVHATLAGADEDGTVVSSAIDFDGDGAPEATADGGALTADFTYAASGDFTVRATVIDDDGAAVVATREVTVSDPNAPPTGSLEASTTSGEAPLGVTLRATASDPDGTVVELEIDPDDGRGWTNAIEGSLALEFPYRDAVYRPRLRLTDDDGAKTVVQGPEIRVLRPVSAALSSVGATGNGRFARLAIAPAIWADGADPLRFTVAVVDHGGTPLEGVPIRVRSLRDPIAAPDGTPLGATETIALDAPATGSDGRLTGRVTTRTSTRVEGVPATGTFIPFDLGIEAAIAPGVWRELPRLDGVNAETLVSGTFGAGDFFVKPQGITCVGQRLEIHVRAIRRSDAPSPGAPVAGGYTEIRASAGGALLPVTPLPGYASWRTDGGGWIRFHHTPGAPDSRALTAWVDGQPLNIGAGLAVKACP